MDELKMIQNGTQAVTLPSWFTRLPSEIGTPQAGSPKAAEWLTLFSVHFVLVLIPKWTWQDSDSPRAQTLIKIIANLISILNISLSHSLNHDSIHMLNDLLVLHRQNLLNNWSSSITPKPTIHFAQHLPEMIKLYGPPSVFATWSGERINQLMTLMPKNKNPSK